MAEFIFINTVMLLANTTVLLMVMFNLLKIATKRGEK